MGMLSFISRRLLHTVWVIIGVTFLIFILIFLISGDPTHIWVKKGASKQVVENVGAKWGLDKPWYVQYTNYMGNILKGDLGESIRYRRPVSDILKEHFPNSVRLALFALSIELILGLIAGIISAIKRYSFLDVLITISTAVLIAMPVFWLGMLLQDIFGLRLGWLPVSGMGDGGLSYYILPALTMASVSTAVIARITRASLLDVTRKDYILAARAKGLPERKVILKHALRNALIPVVTVAGIDLGVLIGSAILTETIFAWPGIGRVIFLAIGQRDYPVILGATLLLVLVFILANLIVDISYAYLDPRIRHTVRT